MFQLVGTRVPEAPGLVGVSEIIANVTLTNLNTVEKVLDATRNYPPRMNKNYLIRRGFVYLYLHDLENTQFCEVINEIYLPYEFHDYANASNGMVVTYKHTRQIGIVIERNYHRDSMDRLVCWPKILWEGTTIAKNTHPMYVRPYRNRKREILPMIKMCDAPKALSQT